MKMFSWRGYLWGNPSFDMNKNVKGFYSDLIEVQRIKNTDNWGVADCWRKGIKAKTRNGNMTTDGKIIFSYALIIGFTDSRGRKIAIDSRGFSRSTSRHMTCLSTGLKDLEISRNRYEKRFSKRVLKHISNEKQSIVSNHPSIWDKALNLRNPFRRGC
jgi:hypothetical protein